MSSTSGRAQEVEGAFAEVTKTKDTAFRLAEGDYPESADHIRVLAGLIGQLAEQVERLMGVSTGSPAGSDQEDQSPNEVEAPAEEDRTPERAPAEPANDRSK